MKSKLLFIILTLFLVIYVGYVIVKSTYGDFVKYCDEKFGVGNWTVVETTGTSEAPRFFIGQSWKCVKK